MANFPRRLDLVDRIIRLERRLNTLELRLPPKTTENFIIDPVVVREFPRAPAPPRGQIIAVFGRLGSGDDVAVTFNIQHADGTVTTLDTLSLSGDGALVYHELTDPYDLEHGEAFFPAITSAPDPDSADAARDLTASFVMAP